MQAHTYNTDAHHTTIHTPRTHHAPDTIHHTTTPTHTHTTPHHTTTTHAQPTRTAYTHSIHAHTYNAQVNVWALHRQALTTQTCVSANATSHSHAHARTRGLPRSLIGSTGGTDIANEGQAEQAGHVGVVHVVVRAIAVHCGYVRTCVNVCVCACVHACVHVCVCVCVCESAPASIVSHTHTEPRTPTHRVRGAVRKMLRARAHVEYVREVVCCASVRSCVRVRVCACLRTFVCIHGADLSLADSVLLNAGLDLVTQGPYLGQQSNHSGERAKHVSEFVQGDDGKCVGWHLCQRGGREDCAGERVSAVRKSKL